MNDPRHPTDTAPHTVLVTGGNGFIGSNLLVQWVTRRPDLTFVNVDCLTYAGLPESLAPVADAPNLRQERVDIRDAAAVQTLIETHRPKIVLHLAAESHVDRSILGPRQFLETNVGGTFNLLDACRNLWAGDTDCRFHHVSTDEVFGSLGPSGQFSETTPYDPRSPYSASKAASDHFVRAYHETFGLPVSITNCSNNYGPRQNPEKLIPLMIQNALAGKPLPVYGDGGNVRDWLFVTDHADAIWEVAYRGAAGQTYCVGGETERTNLELLNSLLQCVAEGTGKSLATLQSQIQFVKDRPGHDRRYAIDCSKIKADLGWQPSHQLEDGLRETVDWYLANPAWIEAARARGHDEWVKRQYVEAGRA